MSSIEPDVRLVPRNQQATQEEIENLAQQMFQKLQLQQQKAAENLKIKMQEEIVESKMKLEEFINKSKFPKTQERRYKSIHEKACQTAGQSSSLMAKPKV